ncbi:MAG: recombinase family protein [Patescibacteria group bacterium]
MKAIILSRVSTKEQAEEGQSISAQTRRLTEYVEKRELDFWKVFEIAESSTTDSRKKFEAVLDVIKQSKFGEPIALVVETVDRLQRSFKESVVLDDLRKQGKIEIHFVRENLVLTASANSSQLLQWDMAVMFARSYVLQLSDNVKRSNEQKLKNGEWIAKAPIGYLNTRTSENKSAIEVDPKTAPFVIKAFELYSTGNFSLITLSKRMREEGFKGSRNGNPIAMSRLAMILKTRFYYGVMDVKGKQYPHHYESLISMSLFLKCQKVCESWNKKPFQHAAKPFIFRGLMTCGVCGCTITPEISKGKYIYYHCTNYRGKCQKLYVPEEELLKPIYAHIKKLRLPKEGIDYVVSGLRVSTEAEQEFHSNAMDGLKTEYDRIESRISKMTDDKYDGSITPEMYDKKLKEYKAKQADLLQQMQEHSSADKEYHLTASRLLDICKRAFEIFESSEPQEKRVFLNFVLQNSVLNARTPVFTMKPVFAGIIKAHETHKWGA